ncbi:hypothetical protein [Actinomadura chokoriensis]|uniref:hypothetical protein n=1 Tax=Actinomadura chokoriensis TaxID=454156 RepID=UPI0031F78525
MTFYDDAELRALAVVRESLAEDEDGDSRTQAMHRHAVEMFEQHGSDGLTALVVALGRFGGNALTVLARRDNRDPVSMLEEFELHKLEQHAEDDEFGD